MAKGFGSGGNGATRDLEMRHKLVPFLLISIIHTQASCSLVSMIIQEELKNQVNNLWLSVETGTGRKPCIPFPQICPFLEVRQDIVFLTRSVLYLERMAAPRCLCNAMILATMSQSLNWSGTLERSWGYTLVPALNFTYITRLWVQFFSLTRLVSFSWKMILMGFQSSCILAFLCFLK